MGHDLSPTLFRESIDLLPESAAGDAPTWVQITTRGHFKGHGQGTFSLNDKTLGEIVQNYRDVDGGQVAFDYEHASELDATSGSIPTSGAPAQAWIRDMRIEAKGLFALVDWLEPARSQVREKKYRFVSPAIVWDSRHPVSGEKIGARLTSVALTNRPFLRGLAPLAAKDTSSNQGATMSEDAASNLLKETTSKLTASEAQVATLTLQLNERQSKITALEADVTKLRADGEARDATELAARVDEAFETHKDAQKLTDKHKAMMMVAAKADRKAFDEVYPRIKPGERHLLRDLTGTGGAGGHREPPARTTDAGAGAEVDLTLATETHEQTTLRLMKADASLTLSSAISEAAKLHAAR